MASPIVPHPSTVSVSVLASMAAQLSHKTRARASIGSAGSLWQARRVSSRVYEGGPLVRRAAGSTVASLFLAQARLHPERAAIVDGTRRLTYGALAERVRRLAGLLDARGWGRGTRLAILSENRAEYLELFLAAAMVGAVVACQNCRLAPPELARCLDLIEPEALFASPGQASKLAAAGRGPSPLLFGEPYESLLQAQSPLPAADLVDPEDPLLILYTSGTTGLPKGAVISHRAEIARNLVVREEYGLAHTDTFVAWSPLYHMGAADCSLGTLMVGGQVITVDGFDRAQLAEIVAREELGLLLLMPGMVSAFATELEARAVRPKGVKICGVMADLVPPAEIARITRLLGAPYGNTFGATETGWPPCSSNSIPVGVAPTRLPKEQSPYCEVKLVDPDDPDDREVGDGQPGELCMRGPTLFSGYFRADTVNAQEFRGGWFHLGDVFVRHPDGTLDFVDRVKYLIKSGGENIYPAEIERLLLQDPRVAEVAVVRGPDPRWGEVPIAFVARRDPSLSEGDLFGLCRAGLAGYKQPRQIRFIAAEDFPRSASGKIQRHELEKVIR
jgi:acyl-CoA synthetase (AMP-forming)/AMP-acid ligase II